jgi:hypothetical protein
VANDACRPGIYGMQRGARAVRHDIEAARNAVLESWSNGQTKGQISRLKTPMKTVFGRAGTDSRQIDSVRRLNLPPEVPQSLVNCNATTPESG